MYEEAQKIAEILEAATTVVIIQADNPDGDSLGSALALEHIMGDLGKQPYLYCAVDMPTYLQYMHGWDRVQKELPTTFDVSIIVDASTVTLLEKLANSPQGSWLATKPCIVLDHHSIVEQPIPYASVVINDSNRSSTGELIYSLGQQLQWPVSVQAQECIMTAILGDTQGLSNHATTAETYRVMAAMIEAGVDRPQLEELRREYGKMHPEIFRYKAELLKRTAFSADGRIASVSIPYDEIRTYSPLYNPAPLIQNDMLQTIGVQLAIVFKEYDDGHMTAAIRANSGAPVAGLLAEKMGGGGHPYASGFKVNPGSRSFEQITTSCLGYAQELLTNLPEETHEAIQYTF